MERRGKGRKEKGEEQWREGRIEERRKRGWGNTNHLLTAHPQFSLTITPHTPPLLTHPQSSLTITPHTPPFLTHPQSSLTITPHTPPFLTHPQSSHTITPHTSPLLTHPQSSHTITPHTPHQSTVDRDALLGSLSRCPSSLQSLGPSQINKVELGSQSLPV